ncbi:hypothetical protein Q7C36_019164 [Tachysurus vachellii]|uniref:Uncharacterized protein n=1 Tax=Tachysurus vachellii TaxID=175792 RepID=A0AA88LWJ9_TACVA|nr:hypothetical protein Q7C36_019164 [Tachysurus vachellii]
MSSVNSAACLLARNHFYQNISPTNKLQPAYTFPGSLSQARQRQETVWKTASSHRGFSEQEQRRWGFLSVQSELCLLSLTDLLPSTAEEGLKEKDRVSALDKALSMNTKITELSDPENTHTLEIRKKTKNVLGAMFNTL